MVIMRLSDNTTYQQTSLALSWATSTPLIKCKHDVDDDDDHDDDDCIVDICNGMMMMMMMMMLMMMMK